MILCWHVGKNIYTPWNKPNKANPKKAKANPILQKPTEIWKKPTEIWKKPIQIWKKPIQIWKKNTLSYLKNFPNIILSYFISSHLKIFSNIKTSQELPKHYLISSSRYSQTPSFLKNFPNIILPWEIPKKIELNFLSFEKNQQFKINERSQRMKIATLPPRKPLYSARLFFKRPKQNARNISHLFSLRQRYSTCSYYCKVEFISTI